MSNRPDTLSWTSHPWAEEPVWRRVLLVLLVLGASVLAADVFESAWVGLVSVGFLFVSLSRYFIPSTYELTSEGVRVRHFGLSRFYPWSRFRRAVLRSDGVFLGTFSRARRLDVWRGCYLRCPRNQDAVYSYARAHIPVDKVPAGG